MPHDKQTMSIQEALDNISARVCVLEDQIISHRAVFSVLKSFLIENGTIDRTQFNAICSKMAESGGGLGMSDTAAEQFKIDMDALAVRDDEMRPMFQVIKGGKED